jgi:tRNA threonylcarbamoyladenosine biosynthesis protein TsaE
MFNWQGGISNSPEESIEMGISLSKFLKGGDIILLNGDLAVGKTTFVKGILKGLNYNSEVTSPTFTLINEYDADTKVIHMDCYREHDLTRWINLGIQEYFYSDDIIIIEWPEVIQSLLPNHCIKISIKNLSESSREFIVE